MKIRVLIVDDERIAREGVMMRLESAPEFRIIGTCANGLEAVSFIRNEKPDLVFLDVQMPGLDGFGVIEKIGISLMPLVIFVTAYDKYALRAFEYHALDYLLKPFDEERFNRTLERARQQLQKNASENFNLRLTALMEDLCDQKKTSAGISETAPRSLEKIVVKTGGRIYFVSTEEIDWVEAADNYVRIYAGRETHLVREKISSLAAKLDPQIFLRIHRSIIVNTKRIQELRPMFDGVFIVVLKDGSELTSGRHFRENFQALLNN